MANEQRTIEVSDKLWKEVRLAALTDGVTIREWFDKLLTETIERRKKCNKSS